MVKEFDGNGQNYRDFLKAHDRLDGHRHTHIVLTDANRQQANDYLSQNPKVDKRTWLVENVVNSRQEPISLLSGSKIDMGPLKPRHPDSPELPPEGQTYIATVEDPVNATVTFIPLLTKNASQARNVAKNQFKNEGADLGNLRVDAALFTPPDFVEMVQVLIDNQIAVSKMVMRFAGLRAYKEDADRKRKESKSA